jgi:dTMP kinase
MDKKAPLIVIEGIDFAGKTTQTRLLAAVLQERGRETVTFHYPSQDTELGRLIARVLEREISIPDDALFALFAANRLESGGEIEEARSRGAVVICDRYTPSEYAYGEAKGLPPVWLHNLESRMPEADLSLLLDISAADAVRRSSGRKRDMFESDPAFLELVRRNYLRQAGSNEPGAARWALIDADADKHIVTDQILGKVLSIL